MTQKLRRVARFDASLVRAAIAVNHPTLIVMNHIDYVDARCSSLGTTTDKARKFIRETSDQISAKIDLVGLGPSAIVSVSPKLASAAL